MTRMGQRTGRKSHGFMESQRSVGIYEFAQRTGYSYKHVYEQVRLGKLPARKERGVWLIPRAVLEQVVRDLVRGAGDSDNAGGN